MIDRLAVMVGLLPASQEPTSAERFQCALGCVVMGVALNRLREPPHDAGVVPLELQPLLGEALREVAAYIAGGADAPRQDLALAALRRFGRGLEALLAQPSKDLGATRQRFIMNVAVLILQQSLQRYRTLLEEDRGAPAVVEEPEEEGGHAR